MRISLIIALLLWPLFAFGQVAQLGSPVSLDSSATMSYTVSAGSNRLLIVAVSGEGESAAAPTVDYGGQAMTQVANAFIDASTISLRANLFRLNESGVAAASNTTITVTGGEAEISIHAQAYSGVNQTTPIAETDEDVSDDNTNPVTTLVITNAAGNIAVFFAVAGAPRTCTWANASELTDDNDSSSAGSMAHSTSTGAINAQCTWSGNPNRTSLVAAEIAQAAAAVTRRGGPIFLD